MKNVIKYVLVSMVQLVLYVIGVVVVSTMADGVIGYFRKDRRAERKIRRYLKKLSKELKKESKKDVCTWEGDWEIVDIYVEVK